MTWLRKLGLRVTFFVSIVSMTAGVACDDDGGGSGNADAFVGNWTFDSGTIEPMCTGVTVNSMDLTGATITITKVDGSHIRATSTTGITCNVTFAVSGSTATSQAGGTCTVMVPNFGAATVNITSWTLTLSGDKLMSNLNGSASIGGLVSCTPMSTATLSKS
jgi:hypothetical protein